MIDRFPLVDLDVHFKAFPDHAAEALSILTDDMEERAVALADAFQRWKKGFSPAGVVIRLPLGYFSFRVIDMPMMARDDMRRALQFEMEKHLHLPVDEYAFDFLTSKGQNGYRTLVFSIKKDTVNALCKTVSDAGMQVVSIRCRTIDLLNSMAEISHEKQIKGVFIHASDDDYELAAIEETGVVFVKRIPKHRDLADEVESALQQCAGKVYASGDL